MKNLNLILAVIIGVVMFSCKSAPTTEEALECNKNIMNYTGDLDKTYNAFKDSWNEYDLDTFDVAICEEFKANLKSVQDKVTSSLSSVNANKEYEGIPDFKNYVGIAVDYYKAIGSMCDSEYTEIVSLIEKGNDLTSEDQAKCFAIDSIISVKHENACGKFIKFQEEFAKKYNFELEVKEASE